MSDGRKVSKISKRLHSAIFSALIVGTKSSGFNGKEYRKFLRSRGFKTLLLGLMELTKVGKPQINTALNILDLINYSTATMSEIMEMMRMLVEITGRRRMGAILTSKDMEAMVDPEINRKVNDQYRRIGANIRKFRCEYPLTIEELSKKTNIEIRFLELIEKGDYVATRPTLIKLASALNVTMDDILHGMPG